MRKIAIVGMAEFDDAIPDDHEVWVIAKHIGHFPRHDAAFECHEDLDKIDAGSAHEDFVNDPWVPFYVPEHLADLYPKALLIPVEVMAKLYKRSFGSTISYMLAQAIYEGVDEIALYGVGMELEDTYGYQRPSAYYWIGVANGRGIKTSGFIEEQTYGLKGKLLDGQRS